MRNWFVICFVLFISILKSYLTRPNELSNMHSKDPVVVTNVNEKTNKQAHRIHMMFKRFCTSFSIMLLLAMLVACGSGGGSDSDTTQTQPLRVNAGANIQSNEQQTVNLLGASSGGSGQITFTWSNTDDINIEHPDNTLSSATLTTPIVTQTQIYTVTLTAADASGNQATDTLVLTVNPVNEPPVADIQTNQIASYNSLHYPVTSTIQLDGGSSSDPDAIDGIAPIASYLWQQIAGPNLLAGIDTKQSSIQVIAPIINQRQQAVFRLTVVDQEQASNSTDLTLTLLAQEDTIPTIEITSIPDVMSGELLPLKAVAQSDAPAATPFSYNWITDGLAIIDDPSNPVTVAIAPLVLSTSTITYNVRAEDSFRNSVSGQRDAKVFPVWEKRINDTGVSVFSDGVTLFGQYQHNYPAQDAAFGSDRQVISGTVNKLGEGEASFDFTRLDNNGNDVNNPSFAFSCVQDNVTGLVWQIKSNSDQANINFVQQSFTWFSDEENGNVEGELNPMAESCNVANGQCNTQDYISEINSQGLCGFFDWRLPSVEELQSIIHYGSANQPRVDQVFFPYLGSSDTDELWYWTSQSSADGVSNDLANNAWALDLNSGKDGFFNKSTLLHVMLVRAGD